MAATIIPNRFTNAYTLGVGSLVVPALADKWPFFDASNSDGQAYSTLQSMLFNMAKTRHRSTQRYFTDCEQEYGLSADARFVALASGAGAGSSLIANDDQGRIGIVRLTTGTTAAGAIALGTADNVVRLGGGQWFYEAAINIPQLSTSSERFAAFCGFLDFDFQNNAIWLYDEGGIFGSAQTYWQSLTVAAASATFNSSHTQVTVAASTPYRLGLEVNAAASEVKFYIDGTLRATHTATIPSASGSGMAIAAYLLKNVGTTGRDIDVDYVGGVVDFTTAR